MSCEEGDMGELPPDDKVGDVFDGETDLEM